jgi:TonB-dependent receptor
MGSMPFDAALGLRHETTDVYSAASVAGYSTVVWREGTAAAVEGQTSPETQYKTASYSQFLPNINFNLNVRDDVIVRAAASKTISRASYNDLLGGTVVNTTGTLSGYQGRSGNPGLNPLESTNFDLSAEWYYDEASYVSFGYFKKDVKNWISTGSEPSTIYNLANPLDGAKFDEAFDFLVAGGDPNPSNQDIRNYIFTNYASDPYVRPDSSPNGGEIEGDPATDNVVTFLINIPVNSDTEHTIDGFEFNVQHIFGESGFGGVFNYTMVDTALEYDNTSLADTEALVGLSDTSNLVAFYDKDGLQVRLAYNWRDEFLSQRQVNQDLTAPRYTNPYKQIDMSVSYDLPMLEGMTIFLEGINLTDEYVKVTGRVDPLVYQLTQQGTRYNLGARYTF